MLRAVSGSFRGHDFGLRAHKLAKKQSVFIVNGINFVGAEIAGFFY